MRRILPAAVVAFALAANPFHGAPRATRVGVLVSGQVPASTVAGLLDDLHAGWVRINDHLTGPPADAAGYLRAGVSVVLTINNADPSNIDTTYGSPVNSPNAGFPFRSRAQYQQRIRQTVAGLKGIGDGGQQLFVQCENEITDVRVNPKSMYWRGTSEQYLEQVRAFAEAVRSVSPAIPVVLTSFASGLLDALADPRHARHHEATQFATRLLTEADYDVADLHFYGCADDIPRNIRAVRDLLPAGKRWISTENGGPDSRCAATPISWAQDPVRFEQEQARQVPARLSACAAGGGEVCLWFSLFDLVREADVFAHLGLIAHDRTRGGTASVADPRAMRRKPAYDAFRQYAGAPR